MQLVGRVHAQAPPGTLPRQVQHNFLPLQEQRSRMLLWGRRA